MEQAGCICALPEYCFTNYLEPGYKEEDILVELCETVTECKDDTGELHFKTMPKLRVASIFHKGSYNTLANSYESVLKYVKAKLIADDGTEKEILSFGPFTIHPNYQRKGYGRKLLYHSFEVAREMGYDTVAIWGNPENYACYEFKNCKRFHVCLEENIFPVALMVKELEEEILADKSWKFIESPAHQMDESGFEEFDSTFEQMEKGYSYTQELFYIYSRSNVLR